MTPQLILSTLQWQHQVVEYHLPLWGRLNSCCETWQTCPREPSEYSDAYMVAYTADEAVRWHKFTTETKFNCHPKHRHMKSNCNALPWLRRRCAGLYTSHWWSPIAEIDCRVHDGVPRHVQMDLNNAVYYLLTEVGTALWRTAGADANIKAVGPTASYSRWLPCNAYVSRRTSHAHNGVQYSESRFRLDTMHHQWWGELAMVEIIWSTTERSLHVQYTHVSCIGLFNSTRFVFSSAFQSNTLISILRSADRTGFIRKLDSQIEVSQSHQMKCRALGNSGFKRCKMPLKAKQRNVIVTWGYWVKGRFCTPTWQITPMHDRAAVMGTIMIFK